MKFQIYHQNDHKDTGMVLFQSFDSIHALFDYAPIEAMWFSRHPDASYLQHDAGQGLHWRIVRSKE